MHVPARQAAAGPLGPGVPVTGRVGIVLRLLLDTLPSITTAGRPVAALDCGGGSGSFAVPLAQAGADVTVLDLSADALATLQRRADEAGVSDAVHAVSGDADRLGEVLGPRTFDLVLAHGILDAVERPEQVFDGLAEALRPGAVLSLLVANPAAAVIARALVGELDLALVELRELDGARSSVDPRGVARMCAAHGLVIESRHGVGAFADLVPGSAVDTPAARQTLSQLDFEAAAREPFASLAARVHLLARRPVG